MTYKQKKLSRFERTLMKPVSVRSEYILLFHRFMIANSVFSWPRRHAVHTCFPRVSGECCRTVFMVNRIEQSGVLKENELSSEKAYTFADALPNSFRDQRDDLTHVSSKGKQIRWVYRIKRFIGNKKKQKTTTKLSSVSIEIISHIRYPLSVGTRRWADT